MESLPDNKDNLFRIRDNAIKAGMPVDALILIVDAIRQHMYLTDASGIIRVFQISTSRKGLGERLDSYMTPRGYHRIEEGIGEGLPAGTVFTNRKPTGAVLGESEWQQEGECKILTRILRLRGMEQGINAGNDIDSYDRLIYLHGTNQEQYCGVEASSNGCVRMRNDDIVQLYDLAAEKETWCWIGNL